MLRRAALLVSLLLPLGALAAPTAGNLTVTPSPFGLNDCDASLTRTLTLEWTFSFTSPYTALPSSGYVQVLVSNAEKCPDNNSSTGVSTTIQLQDLAVATTSSTALTAKEVIEGASLTCGSSATVYVCARVRNTNGTLYGEANGSASIQASPPAAPTSVAVTAGENALLVTWSDGSSASGVTVSSWRVAVTPYQCPADQASLCASPQTTTVTSSTRSRRVDGLVLGVTYAVQVYAVASSGNVSSASDAAYGTPINIRDFWEYYTELGGAEAGGCAGGPAGALSLLAVAGLVRAFRRRS